MGLKSWHKYSVDAELGENENPLEASEILCTLVYSMHSTNGTNNAPPRPELYQVASPIQQPASIDRKAIEKLEILIDECDTLEELTKLKPQAALLGVLNHYEVKSSSLTNK
jgi:hypothetical protein